ncbi:hypothetical protein EYF80_018558 [Liparis tanakae]|uniref:Uncharacterized protein n=1 Tax=Liparis tanakae TaxID=230148 RepID=A0A4Z2I083_9TELE|nr:hypothetical protein EYF80_018558 [Liparis tanakae]
METRRSTVSSKPSDSYSARRCRGPGDGSADDDGWRGRSSGKHLGLTLTNGRQTVPSARVHAGTPASSPELMEHLGDQKPEHPPKRHAIAEHPGDVNTWLRAPIKSHVNS